MDAAAAFHSGGANVKALLEPMSLTRFRDDAVVAVTTETRNAAPVLAAAAVENALTIARACGRELWFKKIDSTLRGPVAAELSALAAAMPRTRILFAPANPAAGRTVQQGILRVHGVPVAETEFGRDPANPVRTSSL
ncbi:MAG TPA: four-carbon acid sugar kinase family protein, partial [Opitutus sp.]|nr:four-carbon acid sugar kinase family protein [Opitutus sp.]